MTNPQVENGYTRIANEIIEALTEYNLSGQELRATLFTIRKTYGYHKKEDNIPLTQYAKNLKISKVRACQVIQSLITKNILTVKENINGISRKLSFNKNYEEWKPLRKTLTVKVFRNRPLRKTLTSKDNIQKKKYNTSLCDDSSEGGSGGGSGGGLTPTHQGIIHQEIIKVFLEKTKEVKGITYVFSGGKDGMAVKRYRNLKERPDYKELIDFYLSSEKSQKHLSLSACFSADTINQFNLERQKDAWRG